MSGSHGLITTAELARILDQPNLRLFDCTTYLEPAPEGAPYVSRYRVKRRAAAV